MESKSPPGNASEPRRDDTTGPIPLPTPPQPELSTLRQVRTEMVALYHAAQRNEISRLELKTSIYALSQIAKLIEICKLEERLEALERTATASEWPH